MSTVSSKVEERELTDPVAFAKAVKQRRNALELTQVDLAHELGISQPSVASIESGKSMPEIETVLRLEKILRMPRNSLFDALRKK